MVETRRWTWRMPLDLYVEVKEAAGIRYIPISSWMVNAVRSQLRREQRWTAQTKKRVTKWPSGWPKDKKCFACEGKHDPMIHGEMMKELVESELRYLEKERKDE